MSKKKSKVRLWGGAGSSAKNDSEDRGALSQEKSSEELAPRDRDAPLTHRRGEWVPHTRSSPPTPPFISPTLPLHFRLDNPCSFGRTAQRFACFLFYRPAELFHNSIPPVWSIIHRLLGKVQHNPGRSAMCESCLANLGEWCTSLLLLLFFFFLLLLPLAHTPNACTHQGLIACMRCSYSWWLWRSIVQTPHHPPFLSFWIGGSMCCTLRPHGQCEGLINNVNLKKKKAFVMGSSYQGHSSLIRWWPRGRGLLYVTIRRKTQVPLTQQGLINYGLRTDETQKRCTHTHTRGIETKVLNDSLTFDFHLWSVTLKIITIIIIILFTCLHNFCLFGLQLRLSIIMWAASCINPFSTTARLNQAVVMLSPVISSRLAVLPSVWVWAELLQRARCM